MKVRVVCCLLIVLGAIDCRRHLTRLTPELVIGSYELTHLSDDTLKMLPSGEYVHAYQLSDGRRKINAGRWIIHHAHDGDDLVFYDFEHQIPIRTRDAMWVVDVEKAATGGIELLVNGDSGVYYEKRGK